MERVERIITHPTFVSYMKQIELYEKDRIFCRHDLSHLLDVARIAYIMNLEEKLELSKEWIYATALLHDIGRGEQYQCGTPHHEAGVEIAKKILIDCDYSKEEQTVILDGILEHRSASSKRSPFASIIYRADKISRPCFWCAAREQCNWSEDQKNKTVYD